MSSLAAQEVLRWILKMRDDIAGLDSSFATISSDAVRSYIWQTLRSGQVIPGYGHAVLRKPDPRFEALMAFASARPDIANDPIFQLVRKVSKIAPDVLLEHGKVSLLYPFAPSFPRLPSPLFQIS